MIYNELEKYHYPLLMVEECLDTSEHRPSLCVVLFLLHKIKLQVSDTR